jgi:drug/metabolite transporter (DMT)-like permease
MDIIKTVSNVLGVVCVVIGLLLLPLSIWFFQPAFKSKDRVSLVIAIIVLVLSVFCFIGAYSLFTQGLIQQFIFPLQR